MLLRCRVVHHLSEIQVTTVRWTDLLDQETSTQANDHEVATRVLAVEIRGSMLLNTLEALVRGVGAETRPECELVY